VFRLELLRKRRFRTSLCDISNYRRSSQKAIFILVCMSTKRFCEKRFSALFESKWKSL